jgi:hypothetical protein
MTIKSPSTPAQFGSKDTVGTIFVFALAVLSILGAVGLGFASWRFFVGEVEFGIFWFLAATALGLATLLCVTLPSYILLIRTQNVRYRTSFRLSGFTLALVFVECAAVLFSHH